MNSMNFADVVHQAITFSRDVPSEALVLELIDNRWFQRLRDISQTANTRLVYMFSEHSRFGHCLGVAYLAKLVLQKLAPVMPHEIERYSPAIMAAALLHDIGHLAPGSHTAFKTWFPGQPDSHEAIAERIFAEDEALSATLASYGDDVPSLVAQILSESDDLPPWTWEIISGGGWNVDRGNWCIVDSIMAGVSYGQYNIHALTDSIVITDDRHLALRENRLDAMMHFALSRHAMYRQIYQHRVLLSADMINKSLAQRARDLPEGSFFADEVMRKVLTAGKAQDLDLDTIFQMREPWWRYHLMRWRNDRDPVLADLSRRLIDRDLFKTVRIRPDEDPEALRDEARKAIEKCGLDSRYYLHEISTVDMHAGDYRQSMRVLMDDGKVRLLTEAEPLFNAMLKESHNLQRSWLAIPAETKLLLGRER